MHTTGAPELAGAPDERRGTTSAAKRPGATLKDPKAQFISALLFILTVAAVSCAVINFKQQSVYRLPDDGIVWVDRSSKPPAPGDVSDQNKVVALYVLPGSQGHRAGIRSGDILSGIGGYKIAAAKNVPQALGQIGAWSKTEYRILRGG